MKIGEIMERVDNRHEELWKDYTNQGLKMGFARFLVTGLVMADNHKEEKDTELATQAAALESQSLEITRIKLVANDFKQRNERYKAALGEIASANPSYALIADIIAIAQEALVESASLESQESETETITLSGAVYSLKLTVTQRSETMASFTLDGKKVVVFPKTWLMYRRFILENDNSEAPAPKLTCIVKPDSSRGEVEYILQSIEGVEPDALPVSEESESGE